MGLEWGNIHSVKHQTSGSGGKIWIDSFSGVKDREESKVSLGLPD